MAGTNNLIKSIVRLKEENEKLEELINFYRMENFEYALKCNHVENVLESIHNLTKNRTDDLVNTFDNVANILQHAVVRNKTGSPNGQTSNIQLKTPKSTNTNNKAHVVNPHMVNGHVLYVPTINLTRVSNINSLVQKPNENKPEAEDENKSNNTNQSLSLENDDEVNNTPSGDFHSDNHQLSRIDEVSEPSTSNSPSKSPSHSTVLSGTFQEVKIYLNQVSQTSSDSFEETIHPKRSQKSRRSNVVSNCITKRKRS